MKSPAVTLNSLLILLPYLVAAQSISSGSLASHSTIGDCWIVHNGNVYDVTQWATRHPGGSTVYTAHCGKSGSGFTNALTAKHGTSKESSISTNLVLKGSLSSASGSTSAATSTPPSNGGSFGLIPSAKELIAYALLVLLA
jgi:hypothetical protein